MHEPSFYFLQLALYKLKNVPVTYATDENLTLPHNDIGGLGSC